MKKTASRFIVLLSVVAILIVNLVVPVSAADLSAAEIRNQITTIYQKCYNSKGSSFSGYCGAYVGWQLYHMGINSSYVSMNGNETFDYYNNSATTSGGYTVTSYPASRYTLKSALNAISENGTKNVYNILVGLEKGNTASAQTYGHAVFIHAIIGGMVYFSESSNLTFGGTTYSEGSPICLSIDQVCDSIWMWTYQGNVPQFDGIIHFQNSNTTPTPTPASEGWIWPITGQIFGRGVVGTHCALDIEAAQGTTVCASRSGTVVCAYTTSTAADWNCGSCGYTGAGYHVVIRHSDNSYSFYDHLSAVYTSVGAYVTAGQSVGAVGATGNATGPHLHFAISSSGLYSLVDPLYYVTPFSSVTATVSENDVVLTGTFGAYGPTMQTAGFYIGTDVNNMTKVTETLNTDGYTNGVAIQSIFYSLAKWHNIAKGYTYYYKMYITRDGKEYCSAIYSFAYGQHTCTDATWGTGVVKTEPTCVSTGVRVYTCSVCNATKEEIIPKKTTHTYGEWTTVTPATINAAGESRRYCTVNGCTAYESKVLPQLEHTHDFSGREEIVTPASCTAEGSKKVYCTNSECGEYTLVTLSKTGHTAGEWQIDGNKKVKKCTECGKVLDTVVIDENAPTITVETKKSRAGKTVLVDVILANNPGTWGADLTVEYDKTKLTLVSVTNGTVFADSEWTKGNLSGEKYILSYEANGLENITANGVIATLEFTVNESASVGEFLDITVSYKSGDIINTAFEEIDPVVVSGGIKVINVIYGDVNGDGEVNKKDSLLLKMYLADNSVEIDKEAADVFYDGEINKKDSLYLKQYLAGLDVELGA